MSKGCKIFATLLVLTLCMGANLYAERTRHVGGETPGELDLAALEGLGINPMSFKPVDFDPENMTVDGSKIIMTGDRTARTEDGRSIRFDMAGDKSEIQLGDRSITFYASGAIPVSEPDTYMAFAVESLTFQDPASGMPVNATGAVRLSDFEVEPETPQETSFQSDEYDIRMANYGQALSELQSSGVDSSTYDIGGVEFTVYANGAVLMDPSLPEKLATMTPDTLDELKDAQLPVAIPMFTLDNGSLLFADGALRMTLE